MELEKLIEKLDSTKFNPVIDDIQQAYNDGIDNACSIIEEWFGMNESLGHKLDARTQKACVLWLEHNKYIEKTGNDWLWIEGNALSRYHLQEILKNHNTVRNLGKKGIERIKIALE